MHLRDQQGGDAGDAYREAPRICVESADAHDVVVDQRQLEAERLAGQAIALQAQSRCARPVAADCLRNEQVEVDVHRSPPDRLLCHPGAHDRPTRADLGPEAGGDERFNVNRGVSCSPSPSRADSIAMTTGPQMKYLEALGRDRDRLIRREHRCRLAPAPEQGLLFQSDSAGRQG